MDVNYPNFVDPADVTDRANQNRWEFGAPFDGHVVVFFKDGADVYMYDTTFIDVGHKNLFKTAGGVAEIPSGIRQGASIKDFYDKYYEVAVPYHRGVVDCEDAAGNPKCSVSGFARDSCHSVIRGDLQVRPGFGQVQVGTKKAGMMPAGVSWMT